MGCSIFKCCKIRTDSKIVLKEKQSSFVLINQDKKVVSEIAFDGCSEYSYSGKRCDFILYLKDLAKPSLVFIELKGNNLLKAIRQIEESIEYSNLFASEKKYAYSITSKSPISSSDIQNEKMRLRKKNIIFDTKNRLMEKNYNEH